MNIQIIDADMQSGTGIWHQVLSSAGMRKSAHDFIREMFDLYEKNLSRTGVAVLKQAVDFLNRMLGAHYRAEAEGLAALLDISVSEIVLANVIYDVHAGFCSTFVIESPAGPIHARNLDWSFPQTLQRKHTLIIRFLNAPKGNYATVTWPGLFGVLTGIAPGRFAVTINFCRNVRDTAILSAARRAIKGYWPAMWIVRQVFDKTETFSEAISFLQNAPSIAPVLFTVSGTKPSEGVVIERTSDDAVLRWMKYPEGVFVTNHYVSDRFLEHNQDISAMDTIDRYDALVRGLGQGSIQNPAAALHLLSSPSLLREITQHQAVMRPADGLLVVRVPGQHEVTLDLK